MALSKSLFLCSSRDNLDNLKLLLLIKNIVIIFILFSLYLLEQNNIVLNKVITFNLIKIICI